MCRIRPSPLLVVLSPSFWSLASLMQLCYFVTISTDDFGVVPVHNVFFSLAVVVNGQFQVCLLCFFFHFTCVPPCCFLSTFHFHIAVLLFFSCVECSACVPSPLHVILHDLQGIFVYDFILFLNFVLGFTSMCLSLLFGFTVWVFASCFPQGRLYPFVEPLPCQITLWNYQLLFCAWLLCCHLRPSWWFVLWVFGLVLF